MAIFRDGTVLPSYLSSSVMGHEEGSPLRQNSVQLMEGEVKELVPPTDDRSLTRTYNEYRVAVQHRDGSAAAVVDFPNCLVLNQFGGASDSVKFALRADPTDATGTNVLAKGARVLVLCVDGNASQAYIIGAIRADQTPDPEGLFYEFEYNGVKFAIGNEGQVKLSFNGATDIDGKSVEDVGETSVKIAQNGTLTIATPDQTLTLDKDSKEIRLQSGDSLTVHNNGVKLGGGGESMLKGSTYRQQEQSLHQTLMTQLTTVMTLATTASAALSSAAGMMVTPVVGAIMAAVPMAAAATAMASMVQAIAQMTVAITQFEAQSVSYLSTKHDLD